MKNALSLIAAETGVLVDPLRRVLEDRSPPHELARLLRSAGWSLPGLGSADLDALHADLEGVVAAVDGLPAAVRAGSLPEVLAALDATADAFAALREMSFAGLDAPPGLAQDVADALVVTWLARRRPAGLGIVAALGLVADDARLRLDELPALFGDPIGALQAGMGYTGLGDGRDAQALALLLGARACGLLAALGGDVAVRPPWGSLSELPAADRDAAGRTVTLRLPLPAPDGSPIRPELSVAMEMLSPADAGRLGRRGPGVELRPAGLAPLNATHGAWTFDLTVAATADVLFAGPGTVAGGTLAADAALAYAREDPIVLGADRGTRIELGGARVGLGVELPDASVELVLTEFALVVTAGDGDSFVASALPDVELRADFDLGLAWSRLGGLRMAGGNAGLALRAPIEREIGSVATLHWVDASLIVGDALELGLGAAVTVALGPFSARVEGAGLRVVVRFPPDGDGNLGPVDLALEFKPPTGVAFTLDLGDVGNGGGIVGYDPALGRYFGALELDLIEVGLGATVVIDTRLPDDSSGWALFASVFATFPSLPLGFGFFLSGVGGLMCLNRTLDGDALATGLKSGAVDAILFPDDVIAQLPVILSQLDAWFPPAEGSAVLGVAARITWGTPKAIVTGQLGVAVVLPELEIAVLGSIAIALPSEDEVLLELHMDSLGVIDVAGRTVTVVASLYDSALLGTIHLSGDMALYVSVGAAPYFLLSVGGYHPAFDPPCGLPASVLDLDRMRAEVAISDDVLFALESYVAVTANTLQFGSLATLEASAKFLLTTYTARGSVGFDVLLVFSPFSFSAAMALSVSVSAGEKELMAVELSARLDGPAPWYTSGSARFDFFGIGVRFDFEFGGPAQPETSAGEDVCGLVVEALAAPAAWSPAPPAGADANALVWSAEEEDDELWVRPDAELEARQTIAPLDRELDHYGVFAIHGPTRLEVTGAGLEGATGGEDWEVLVDWFAPAQYDEMSRAEKLAAPSYEEMTTGVRFGAGGVGFDAAEATTVVPDHEERVLEPEKARALRARPTPSAAGAALTLDPARRRPARTVRSATLAVGAPTWRTFDPRTGAPVGPPLSYGSARRAGPNVAPTHALA